VLSIGKRHRRPLRRSDGLLRLVLAGVLVVDEVLALSAVPNIGVEVVKRLRPPRDPDVGIEAKNREARAEAQPDKHKYVVKHLRSFFGTISIRLVRRSEGNPKAAELSPDRRSAKPPGEGKELGRCI